MFALEAVTGREEPAAVIPRSTVTASLPQRWPANERTFGSLNWNSLAKPRLETHDKESPSTVVVIDDDRDIREALEGLLRSVGLRVESFASVQEFLDFPRPDRPSCLVLDVRLPGRSGLDFHDDLIRTNIRLPVVFISGCADVPMSVRAMKAGAVEFLTKPVHPQDVLDAIHIAIERDGIRRDDEQICSSVRADFVTLTPRERQVMKLVVAGCLNKQIAADIGISEATVKLHRGQVMRKMHARSLVMLIRIADKLEPPCPK
jgi:FixJ family two-component response regulator